jgi:hypothetical protein
LGGALAEWKAELIEALGGDDHISPQERVLVETCARDHMIQSSIDGWPHFNTLTNSFSSTTNTVSTRSCASTHAALGNFYKPGIEVSA